MAAPALRSCPRCTSDMIDQTDQYGRYEQCLVCGYHRDITAPAMRPVNPIHLKPGVMAGQKRCKTERCNKLVPLNEDGTIAAGRRYCSNWCSRNEKTKKAGAI